jgi:cullin-associated NEDD8-dissociated protein 1
MYTLLSNSLDRIDVHGFLERVTIALNDQHDIKMLAYLMLIRLGKVAPSAVTQSKKKKNRVCKIKFRLIFVRT